MDRNNHRGKDRGDGLTQSRTSAQTRDVQPWRRRRRDRLGTDRRTGCVCILLCSPWSTLKIMVLKSVDLFDSACPLQAETKCFDRFLYRAFRGNRATAPCAHARCVRRCTCRRPPKSSLAPPALLCGLRPRETSTHGVCSGHCAPRRLAPAGGVQGVAPEDVREDDVEDGRGERAHGERGQAH